jgi:hypothetical protein
MRNRTGQVWISLGNVFLVVGSPTRVQDYLIHPVKWLVFAYSASNQTLFESRLTETISNGWEITGMQRIV